MCVLWDHTPSIFWVEEGAAGSHIVWFHSIMLKIEVEYFPPKFGAYLSKYT